MINEIFHQSDIIWKEYLAFLTVYDVDSFQLRLNKLNVAMIDITLKANILIVPFFDELFIKYVDKVKPIMYSSVQFLTCAVINILLMFILQ